MSVRILIGDVRDRLADLPDESVHCVVTSPPYFGLRDYGMSGQIGLEDTPDTFVAVMVDVFREVRRVLRNDGTLWLNLGDSYANSGASGPQGKSGDRASRTFTASGPGSGRSGLPIGLKAKDLIGIPWRVAFALQADGWYLRQDIIWSKPNPMPESVTDRCTKAHEYLFLLTKSAKYHYDAAAIAEAAAYPDDGVRVATPKNAALGLKPTREYGELSNNGTRNRRSVWTVATQPFSEAHFATFPPALIEPCILAGCPKDCCAKCGAPVVREVSRTFTPQADVSATKGVRGAEDQKPMDESNGWQGFPRGSTTAQTLGWSPSCSCGAGTARGVCLDPFGGAGTTALVADRLGRDAVLIELNEQYAEMAKRRLETDAGMFGRVDLVRSAQKQSRTPAPLSVAPSPDDSAPLPLAAVGGASA